MFGADPMLPRPWPSEALEALFRARVHPADWAVVHGRFGEAMRAFAPISLEYRVVMPDGSVKHMRSEGRRGAGDDYIGTTMDVTAARNIEEQRRRSEAYLAEGQRLTRTGSWGWNLGTGEIFWSREMFRIYGFDPDDGTPPYEAVLARAHPEDAPGVDAGLKASFETGAELRLLTRILVPGERMKWVQTYGHAVRDEAGRMVELIGTVVDVTDRVRAQRRLRRAMKARYAAVLAERTRIARDMHDGLLQDVAGIALQLGALLPHVPTTPHVAARLERILRLAEQAGRTARLAVREMREGDGSADLVAAVDRAARHATARAPLTLTVRVSGRPRGVPSPLCDATASIVQEAVTNVVAHAGARRVTVAVAFASTRVHVTVRDDGRGLVAAAGPAAGEGHFGLVGIRERAAAMGAACAVSSAPGRGTAIRVDVPLRR
jgi:signal transduction histidine kinase